MTREIDITITVAYDYTPPEPSVGLPDSSIEYDDADILRQVDEAIERDLIKQAEDERGD